MRIAVLLAAILLATEVSAQVYGPPGLPGYIPPPSGESGIGDSGVDSSGIRPYLEYKKQFETAQNLAQLDNGLFGESVSLFNGATKFRVLDISLPGNNALQVQLARVIEVDIQPQPIGPAYDALLRGVGNWEVEVPYLSASYPESSGAAAMSCSNGLVPPLYLHEGTFKRVDYWQGVSINVPGRAQTQLLRRTAEVPKPTDSGSAPFTSAERDMFDCIPMKSGFSGQGIRMITADGIKYDFNVGVTRTASRLQGQRVYWDTVRAQLSSITVYVPRKKHFLLASKVEDEFGNSVSFEYNTAGHPTRIQSSDGREIVLTYSNGRLTTATADGRVWKYEYTPNQHLDANPDLARVILPDMSAWTYAYSGNLKPESPPAHENLTSVWCRGLEAQVEQPYVLTATHPSGAKGQFSFENTRHYRSGVHATECRNLGGQDYNDFSLLVPYYFDVMSLTRKTLSGPGMATNTWTYDYGPVPELLWGTPNQPPVYPCATCTTGKTVTVTQPDGAKRRHRFGVLYRSNEGRLLGEDVVGSNGAVLSDVTNEYLPDAEAAGQLFHPAYGNVLGPVSGPVNEVLRPLVSRTVTQQARKFVWRVDKSCGPSSSTYCFDYLARPTRIVRSSASAP